MSEELSNTWESTEYGQGVATKLMEFGDANDPPQKYETNSNPQHVFIFQENAYQGGRFRGGTR